MSTTYTLYVGNDSTIEVSGLQNDVTDAYINDATVSVTLADLTDTEVTGTTWPLTLNYVAASNGIYRATLVDTLSLSAGDLYKATLVADGGAGQKATWVIDILAETRA